MGTVKLVACCEISCKLVQGEITSTGTDPQETGVVCDGVVTGNGVVAKEGVVTKDGVVTKEGVVTGRGVVGEGVSGDVDTAEASHASLARERSLFAFGFAQRTPTVNVLLCSISIPDATQSVCERFMRFVHPDKGVDKPPTFTSTCHARNEQSPKGRGFQCSRKRPSPMSLQVIFSGAMAGAKVDVPDTDRVVVVPVSAATVLATPATTWLDVSLSSVAPSTVTVKTVEMAASLRPEAASPAIISTFTLETSTPRAVAVWLAMLDLKASALETTSL